MLRSIEKKKVTHLKSLLNKARRLQDMPKFTRFNTIINWIPLSDTFALICLYTFQTRTFRNIGAPKKPNARAHLIIPRIYIYEARASKNSAERDALHSIVRGARNNAQSTHSPGAAPQNTCHGP